jgi:hypothetical protein
MLLLSILACGNVKDVHDHDHEEELITRVVLSLEDDNGGVQTYTWSDPEQDGAPEVDTITLTSDVTYQVAVSFWNDLSDPVEEMTPEVVSEAEEHMVIALPIDLLTVSVIDQDANGADLGLEQEWVTSGVGEDTLSLGLRHMPEQDGASVKPTTFTDVESLSGEWDVLVDFPLVVE